MSEFAGKTVFVSGATSGIGRAIALAFAAEGARVGLLGRNVEKVQSVSAEVEERGGTAVPLVADLRQPEQIHAAMEKLAPIGTPLDIAINNAGLDVSRLLAEYTLEEFDAVFETNTRGLFCCMQEEIRRMRPALAGCIINVTSVAARKVIVSNAVYNASKSAVSMLTRTAALEEGPNGIRINELAPGPVETPMLAEFFEEAADSGWNRDALRSAQPLRRIGTPEDIAHAALFLASERASYLCGACLTADGGMSLG